MNSRGTRLEIWGRGNDGLGIYLVGREMSVWGCFGQRQDGGLVGVS